MMKQCPFKTTAVQAQAARLVDQGKPRTEDEAQGCASSALRSARSTFGSCDEEECACWLWYSDPKAGHCGLMSPE